MNEHNFQMQAKSGGSVTKSGIRIYSVNLWASLWNREVLHHWFRKSTCKLELLTTQLACCYGDKRSNTTRCYLHVPWCDDVAGVDRCTPLLPSGPCRHVGDLESSTWEMRCVLLPPGTDLPLHTMLPVYTRLFQPTTTTTQLTAM